MKKANMILRAFLICLIFHFHLLSRMLIFVLLCSDGCKNLEYLNVSWCENIQDRGVQSVLQGCPRLNTLICRGCEGVSAFPCTKQNLFS